MADQYAEERGPTLDEYAAIDALDINKVSPLQLADSTNPSVEHLKIDDKWGVFYEPDNNDRPVRWTRYNEIREPFEEDNNAVTAMFYALLAKSRS